MSLWEQIEGVINETVSFSRQAYERAREIGSITKKEFEIKALQSQVQKVYTRMGASMHRRFSEGGQESISSTDTEVLGFIEELKKIEEEIQALEIELSALRGQKKPPGTADATPPEDSR